ncbi:MAG: hypothetical protein QOJ83_688 [Frankiales bacterium]|nr:hypothetical protein [Frankiales bacterium]
MYEQAVARRDVADQLERNQLLAAGFVPAHGVGTVERMDGQRHRDVPAGEAARLGRAHLPLGPCQSGEVEAAHSMLDSATAWSSSVKAWPIISSIDKASAASFSSTFDMAKPTWMST